MHRFLLHRLSSLPTCFGRLYHRVFTSPRQSRRVKRLLALLGIASCLCLGVQALTGPARAQATTPASPALVLPALPAEPPIYYPGTGETSQVAQPTRPGGYQTVALESATAVAQASPADPVPPDPAPSVRSAEPREPNTAETAQRKPSSPLNRYVMEFNRSPAMGNRLRLEGVYPESRLNFTRPKTWNVQTATLVLRYQHSPALLADQSRLVVRVNDTSVGSIPLNRPNSELAETAFTIPARLIQDNNEITLLAEQQTSETCSNPADPMLWTEVLPSSRVVFDYRPQPMRLDFSSYPLPFIDPLSLEPNHLSYLKPKSYSNDWLTAVARFQTATTRLVADRQALSTQLVADTQSLKRDDRLIVIGTPAEQPILSTLSLPFPLKNGEFVDGERQPVADAVGLLMLTTLKDSGTPVLVATGNSAAGVRQAVQMLVQSRDQKLASGQTVVVDQLAEVTSPDARNWPGYLPTDDRFSLAALTQFDRQPFQDVTVRGTNAPSIAIPFRALPEDRFLRGSTMTLHYSNSPQVNPRNSAVEVKLDSVTIASKRLDANGEDQTFRINLPEGAVRPDSTLNVNFVMYSKELGACGLEADRQLWGTLYSDTGLNLIRDRVVNLPDLKLFQTGYPFTAPQDLAATAIVLPAQPSDTEIQTLLALGERLGRLSQAGSVKYQVYLGEVPAEVRNRDHVIGIGTREHFPVAEVFQGPGFNLAEAFTRLWTGTKVHALPDQEGVVKASLSPWNRERSLLGLTAQTETGLQEVQALLRQDPLFAQIAGDTVLVSRNRPDPSPYDASGYNVQTLQETPPKRIQANYSFNQIVMFLQDYWFFILVGMLLLALLLYALSQSFLNRVAHSEES